jgi:hypothetical protein
LGASAGNYESTASASFQPGHSYHHTNTGEGSSMNAISGSHFAGSPVLDSSNLGRPSGAEVVKLEEEKFIAVSQPAPAMPMSEMNPVAPPQVKKKKKGGIFACCMSSSN